MAAKPEELGGSQEAPEERSSKYGCAVKAADVMLLEVMRHALDLTMLVRELSQLPVSLGDEELARAYRRSRLMQLRRLIERSLELVDQLD